MPFTFRGQASRKKETRNYQSLLKILIPITFRGQASRKKETRKYQLPLKILIPFTFRGWVLKKATNFKSLQTTHGAIRLSSYEVFCVFSIFTVSHQHELGSDRT